MKAFTPFPNQDLKLIKWEITFALISVLLATGIYLGANYLDDNSARELQIARAELERARSSVEFIEEEEATIIEYIDRYKTISEEGVVDEEDRLQFLETIAEIRAENSLFPIGTTIGEQDGFRLQYAPDVREQGGPIDLRFTNIMLSLPLLHEQDLTRLLNAILESPGLYQAQECSINVQNEDNTNYYVLAQHFTADCNLLRYSFDLEPSVEQSGFL